MGLSSDNKTFAVAKLNALAIALATDLMAPTSLDDAIVTFDVLK